MSLTLWKETLASRISKEEKDAFEDFIRESANAGHSSFVLEAIYNKTVYVSGIDLMSTCPLTRARVREEINLCVFFSYGMTERRKIFEKVADGSTWDEIECPFNLSRFHTYALLDGLKSTLERTPTRDGLILKLTVSCF